MSAALERAKRLAAALANVQEYLYDRRINGVPVRDLAKRAGVSEKDMLALLKAHGYTYKQAREDDRLSLMKPYGTTRTHPGTPRSEPTWESMLADVGADHD